MDFAIQEGFGPLTAYWFGVLSSFTPCVYPLIPITLALFGARESKSRIQGFILGLSYVLGIALTYTTLGMISAKLGIIFGSFLGNPWVILVLVVFLFLITLQTLEVIEFKFLSSVQTKASSVGGKGLTGAFLMGTVSGLVAAPCIGPALVAVLSAAAKSQSVAWGAWLLFCYSIGLGTIFLLLATFSGLIQKLPKSGSWLNFVKFFLGCLLVGIIFFIAQSYMAPFFRLLSPSSNFEILLLLGGLAIFIAWYSYRKNNKILRVAAAFLMAFTVYQFVLPPTPPTQWYTDFDEALKQSKLQNKPLFVDLYADWCTACKEFEHITFKDQKVIEKLSTLVAARIDFTDVTAPVPARLTEQYGIPGLPVILLIKPDGSGQEIPGSRITGFLGPEEFLSHLSKHIK